MLDKKLYAAEIGKRLGELYPEAHVELDYTTPFELMIASILAAQNTDKNINRLTPELFRKYRTPADYLASPPGELERDIHKSGFFNQKAKSIRAVCQKLIDDFGGEVPTTMEELLTLPGIGRKTATVVLGDGMGITAGITVDVHNIRLSARLGLSEQKLADKIEKDLMGIVDKKDWILWGQWITWHGRRICHAKKPDCLNCVLNDICPTGQSILTSVS
ncbi:MAG TPA: endonuclease III [Pyrinomonadaceae bacterium]|jgi:endonuclease-3|nr:endonuclease III [Pyrinomonadaceae bacterium]